MVWNADIGTGEGIEIVVHTYGHVLYICLYLVLNKTMKSSLHWKKRKSFDNFETQNISFSGFGQRSFGLHCMGG